MQRLKFVTTFCLIWFVFPANAQEDAVLLPGARPTIDAAKYPSIQSALNAVPEGGGLVQLPAGTFLIEQPLVILVDDTCLAGSGSATHIVNVNEGGSPSIIVTHPDLENPETDREHELWRVRIENLRISGNAKCGHGINARRINELFIDGVTVTGHGGDGMMLDHCYEDPRISDSLITYNFGTGLNLVGCHDIVVSACQFEENNDAVRCSNGFNLCMTGCCVDDHLGNGVVIENTYGSVVSGNMIEECEGTAIVLDRDCYGITLSSNVIAHNGGGIDLADAHGCAVSANTFTIMRSNALRIGPSSGRITVVGNNFSNSYIGGGKVRRNSDDRYAGGLVLDSTNDIAISGNVFAGLSDKAVRLMGQSNGLVFTSNVLRNVESDHHRIEVGTVDNNEHSNADD